MDVHISLDGRRDLSGQIYRQLRAAIRDGRLRPDDALPPTRELARRLDVARNTVSVAYDRLMGEGYLTGRVGSGTFVSEAGTPAHAVTQGSALRPRPVWDSIAPWPSQDTAPVTYDFRVGVPDTGLFPHATWRRMLGSEQHGYGNPVGHKGLRAAIARHIGVSRAVRTGPGDIVITSGIQQALDLICRVMLEPGDRVAVEDPGYPPAHLLFRSLGADVVRVPVDDEGLCVDALPPNARIVYVTPSHQFPLGVPMSLRRRTALLDWARRHEALVIEDDYDTEFRFGGRPIEPLQNLDSSGHVVYVGSFSKTMLPSLRIGFLVAPAPLRQALRAAKYVSDWASPMGTQAALARFIDEGLLARHIRRMRREYQARHELLTTNLPSWLTLVPCAAGLHVTALAKDDPAPAVTRMRAAGVAIMTLAECSRSESAAPGLVFGYGAITSTGIAKGLELVR
ncbi:PLP-dependent aminotransferase family protein [Allokutzneria sp. A3M-2-11 16]|uniref:MocR-like pyridoxine biosynthesis transcription factor PdxR n=1 Tax=Allokutzneria sp. A3M-2-11 16 TaxID=2962043 RepID=UPI0020B6B175|nr:PLP-dependent aminotransferase family protein [Allokutzneria sp. A3M-2-11 16]MCP3805134.1 PLP-dependent aminotransferase family protein [Allokutzneria sp. A3M-2-11 16]